MSNKSVTFPAETEIKSWPPPRLGKFIRDELGHDPSDMDKAQRIEFILVKKAEAEKPKGRGAKAKADKPAPAPETNGMADLKNKVSAMAGVTSDPSALAASIGFTPEQTKWLVALERRLATIEAAVGVAAASVAPPETPQQMFPNIAEFIKADKDGNLDLTLPIAKVDELTEIQCRELMQLIGQDVEEGTSIRILKMRLKKALQEVYNQDQAAASKSGKPAAAPATSTNAKQAKPAAAHPSGYKHGDILIVKWDGEPYDSARLIRFQGKDKALVHWDTDQHSTVDVSDIVGKSKKKWTGEMLPEDAKF